MSLIAKKITQSETNLTPERFSVGRRRKNPCQICPEEKPVRQKRARIQCVVCTRDACSHHVQGKVRQYFIGPRLKN